MIALLGPPPAEFLQRCGEKAEKYWEADGKRVKFQLLPRLPKLDLC